MIRNLEMQRFVRIQKRSMRCPQAHHKCKHYHHSGARPFIICQAFVHVNPENYKSVKDERQQPARLDSDIGSLAKFTFILIQGLSRR